MDKHSYIFLDSTCKKAMHLYLTNTSTDFPIELPQRLKFNRHWQITLKTLFLPNRIHNIKDCYLEYENHNHKRMHLKRIFNYIEKSMNYQLELRMKEKK